MAAVCQEWAEHGGCKKLGCSRRLGRVSFVSFLRLRSYTLTTLLHSYGLTLDQRIQYLSLAISNAKSTSGDSSRRYEADGEFLKDTEDKLDVATVQLEIYSRLVPMVANPDEDPKVQDLASRLLTLQEVCGLSD